MKWFRFWTDTLDDVKILQLSDYEYRIWTYLLAMACELNSKSGECQVNVKSMSLRCRTQVNHFSRAIETFQKLGLITISEEGYPVITNWNKRQYKSDNVTARVRKFREVTTKRNVSCNVSETGQITDTETDKRKGERKAFSPPSFDEVFLYCKDRSNNINANQFIDFYAAKGWMVGKNKMKDWKACIRTWESRNGNDAQEKKPWI